MSARNGWHPGELAIQEKLGYLGNVVTHYTAIQADLPSEQGRFYATCLPFIALASLDKGGRPWGSILAGKDGEKGFVSDKQYTRLNVKAKLWDGDPLEETIKQFGKSGDMLIAGIGVELPTRQRNKFAGVISKVDQSNELLVLELFINQAIAHCPKYINLRDLEPRLTRTPSVAHRKPRLQADGSLPEGVIQFIRSCDTVFIGTTYVARPEDAERLPNHVGINHRGGQPGFIRVRNDHRTLVLPDYSGDRMMTSLGNIEVTPLASLTFVDFTTGDILYITGDATNLVGVESRAIIPFQNALTTIYTTGFIFVRDALPVRQKAGVVAESSPYNPPVRLLAEESSMKLFVKEQTPKALLTKIAFHSPNIATFSWESSKDLIVQAGQAIILDCSCFLGTPQYQYLAPFNPASVNDGYMRTWTISSAAPTSTRTFSLTLRHKPGGVLTSAIFSIAQKLQQHRPELMNDLKPLDIKLDIAGITGRFVIYRSPSSDSTVPAPPKQLLWFACGIGLTPFLSMIRSLTEEGREEVNIRFILSTREPEALIPLVSESYDNRTPDKAVNETNGVVVEKPSLSNINISLDVFHSKAEKWSGTVPVGIQMAQHSGRLDAKFIEDNAERLLTKDVYICGPDDYVKLITDALKKLGVDSLCIKTEGFTY